MSTEKQIIEAVYERDIDLLLIEEFLSDLTFTYQFLSGTNIPIPVSIESLSAMRSVTDDSGETDIRVEYLSEKGPICLLIENKIDAAFQPNQQNRYESRKRKITAMAFTILVAPKEYIKDNHGFDFAISYESLFSYFDGLGLRGKYKNEILVIAIEKLRRGYQAINDARNLRFQLCYWEVINEFPQYLKMDRPEVKPKGSTWIKLRHSAYPKLNIYHKLNHNRIDIEIPRKFAEQYRELIAKFEDTDKLVMEYNSVIYIRTMCQLEFNLDEDPEIHKPKLRRLCADVLIKLFDYCR
jgi:hypothetical protein